MPKDPTKNVDRYKIRGGVINEYEYHENQEAVAQNEARGDGKLIPGTPPEQQESSKIQPPKGIKSTNTKTAAKRVAKQPVRGATAKKLAARKAAKK